MQCQRCASRLARPGDFCLNCRTTNTESVVVEVGPKRASVTMLAEVARGADPIRGQTAITTTPEPDPELEGVALRNYAGQIADEIRRKRPESVFVSGERDVIRALRAALHYEVFRVPDADPLEAVLDRRGERSLEVIETPPAEKLGGSHTTLIGDRDGERAITTVAAHPNVKKIVPGPIDASGGSSAGGLRAKVTRSDSSGNLRLLVRDGSSVQENRVITTAMDYDSGERVASDLNEALTDEGLREQ